MLTFFDYLYLRFFDLCKTEKRQEPEFEASTFMAGFQTMNILSVLMAFNIFILKADRQVFPAFIAVVILIAGIQFNYIRYLQRKQFHYKEILAEWESQTDQFQSRSRSRQLWYLGITVLVFAYLLYYYAATVRG